MAVAWFTAPEGEAKVNVVFSADGGENFDTPINISKINPMGRVDIAMVDDSNAIVSWVESEEAGGMLKFVTVNKSGEISEPMVISSDINARRNGFPQMELVNNKLYFAWTKTNEENKKTTIITASVSF
ncbi:MAG: hypothetical protein HRT66_07915 [Flavobacteriaceae bacterium]|nr:hypothetical protein [Flavobacteriaceae bacterium]